MEKIIKVEKIGCFNEYVYDLEIKDHSSFLANDIIVHNTDSFFVDVKNFDNIKQAEKLMHIFLNHLLGEKSKYFKIDFEKYFSKLIIPRSGDVGAKKKYIGRVINDSGKKVDYIYTKGTELVKADQCEITKRLLKEVVDYIFESEEPQVPSIVDIIKRYRRKILKKEVNVNDIIIVKKVSKMPKEYTNMPAHVKIADERHKKGERYYIGQKVPFIVIENSPLKIVHVDDFDGKFDEKYYWQQQLFKPIFRLLEAAFPKVRWLDFEDCSGQQRLF